MSDKYAKFEDYAGDADLVFLDSVWIEEQAKVCEGRFLSRQLMEKTVSKVSASLR